MLLADLARTSAEVAATSSRTAKTALLADALRAASYDEVPIVVAYLSGELRQRRTGVGYRSLQDLPAPADDATLTVAEVDAVFERIARCAGPGSQGERARLLAELLGRATADEQRLLVGLVGGELRQGALESLVADAAAKAAGVPVAGVRQAAMRCGALAPVAAAVLQHGGSVLATFRLEVGRAVQPMLAGTAKDVSDALSKVSPAAVEWKLDGVRVQVHRRGDEVRVFTRTLDEISERLPEVVAAARSLPVESAVLDGETIALDDEGRPRAFQVTSSRVASRGGGTGVALTTWFFDLLHLDGVDLLDEPAAQRWTTLAAVVPEALRVPRIVTSDVDEATSFAAEAIRRGHEGVVVKSLDATYEAGRRGAGWLKVKPRHTLDLVVLAAEWGHGRRRGWLSNLHLGALDPATGDYVMLGKTFKGLPDELLRWQTERLLALETDRNDWQVFVRPELVVEIAFDGVQTSSRYPGGMALRFARVLRYRDDKRPDEADTVDAVRALHLPAR
ncbi:MAG TPA: ATP-dependent DNA ligase [Mycobacteriales bacterium]|nr:ATP-dependent DNA ligase [Mycobacteriales bacterium]